eukprot:CAMPEP_0201567996 /NCGR_PEP_ID=MMETSP0190_2-20130828/8812_1 /ASSEMBLY_ACC=CAM_ASM_000263 /TAXON_ID=37353 /ORGANISM="Rosalina sp." /LENGTH=356 /DNA_ID=CAMNT_0047988635 /DNA_START=35 /DNA_END=1102 /DNA_ORIENTATION=+
MGQTCGCDGDGTNRPSAGANPDIKPERRPIKPETNGSKKVHFESVLSSDEEDEYDSADPSSTMDNDGGYESSAGGALDHTKESQDEAIDAFKEAIQKGDEKTVMYYVDEFSELDLFKATFENGDNCLQIAVRNSSYNLIYYLLTNGISPDAQNENNGETALHTAVRIRDLKVVTLLSKYKANPEIKNKKDETALTIATENRDDDILELLSPDTQEIIRQRLGSGDSKAGLDLPSTDINKDDTTRSEVYHDMADDVLSDDDENGTPKKYNVRVSKPNAFSNLKRNNTRKVLGDMQQIQDNKDNLPILEAWLEKKSTSMGRGYQKRWVAVSGSYLLWSDWQREVYDIDVTNAKERKKW